MKQRQIIILSVILGSLILGILLKSWIRSAGEVANSAQKDGVTISKLDPEKVERILLSRPATKKGRGNWPAPVEIVKEDGIWKVKSLWNVKANPLKVEDLIRKLSLVKGDLRGKNKKLFSDFGIQDANAFSIKFFGSAGDAPLLDLLLGTKQAGSEGYFVRRPLKEEVYFIELNMSELLGIYAAFEEAVPRSDFWTDLRLFDLDPEKVAKITASHLKGDGKTLVLGLASETDPQDPLRRSWKFLRKDMKFQVDPEKALEFIVVLNSVRAQKVLDPSGKDYGLKEPAWQLAATEGNKKIILNVGVKDEKNDLYYAQLLGDPTIFGLSADAFSDLNVDDTHFVKDASLAADPEAPAAKDPKGQTP